MLKITTPTNTTINNVHQALLTSSNAWTGWVYFLQASGGLRRVLQISSKMNSA